MQCLHVLVHLYESKRPPENGSGMGNLFIAATLPLEACSSVLRLSMATFGHLMPAEHTAQGDSYAHCNPKPFE
jgi:hypothetical protein